MIDLHCDTISKLSKPWNKGSLLKNKYSVDVERLEKSGGLIQCFSTFFFSGMIPGRLREQCSYPIANRRIDVFEENISLCKGRLIHVKDFSDIEQCLKNKKVGGLLTLEDGVPVGDSMDKLHHFYQRGIRLITLTWNYENAIGHPNSANPQKMEEGLKPFGLDMLEEMNRLGIVVDVSHLSDGGFWDVAKYSRKPFIASHSNARSVTAHPRNLTDEMIRTIADKGGVIGLNFCPRFLGEDKISRISHMLRHVKHIYDVGGEDVLALGTDFDGIVGTLQIKSCDQLNLLSDALKKHKMPARVVDKMWQENALRVFKETL
ncbi:MAG: dipeptidase [Eubacteriales bacterium]|nr:dipeptidase [Eubacteriales bacterium]